ncbi:MAG: ATP-binding domain-containing protein, partial [Clostridia bacterium]|nr:ATP-binding domain-containing protein [Clostridia bacterium]
GRIANYTKTDLAQLTLSYAITIHKSQGSEFDVVLIPLTGGAPSIMTRNLLYTAVTRAKKMVVLVGQQFHLKIMVNNNYTATRYSALDKFILEQKSKMEDLLG